MLSAYFQTESIWAEYFIKLWDGIGLTMKSVCADSCLHRIADTVAKRYSKIRKGIGTHMSKIEKQPDGTWKMIKLKKRSKKRSK